MRRFQRTPRPALSSALHAALSARGFAIEDFRVEELSSSRLAQWLGVVGGVLKVRCRSTGEERLYSIGSGSAWLGAFLMDVGAGHFADAARSHGNIRLPMLEAVSLRLNA